MENIEHFNSFFSQGIEPFLKEKKENFKADFLKLMLRFLTLVHGSILKDHNLNEKLLRS